MESFKYYLLFLVVCVLNVFTTGCAITTPSSIETIEGPATNGIINRPLDIIGVLKLATTSGNVSDANNSHFVRATVEVPLGTAVIVPALKGWALGYGEAQPSSTNPSAEITWSTEDHNWGMGNVEISIIKINPPNFITVPPSQTAEISVRFYLSDDNHDDAWFGAVNYHLLCLGIPGVDPSDWTRPIFDPPKMIAVPY